MASVEISRFFEARSRIACCKIFFIEMLTKIHERQYKFFFNFFQIKRTAFSFFVVQYAHIIYTLTTMKYEIEKDVPMPERNVRGKPIKYDLPLAEMDKGDHIFINLRLINFWIKIWSSIFWKSVADKFSLTLCFISISFSIFCI